ncbi:ABC transporter ATP-binding protein [Mycoplasma sp. 744]|uniref:ABC transporter ATP-binding protein n=1 Tax=unclassified Mycoplasma TaxID=2683645 RepID=UPI00211C610B|nr:MULTISPECIES: ABC transporter ATP-binding protein [unclassified Mycoplasma]MEA4115385.1 ABC transporter ATP-binding protein [Mycoplasma sp. 744]UUM19389.1 ABC transporter ATP-binding protein [Mycoplasma sp. 1018B]
MDNILEVKNFKKIYVSNKHSSGVFGVDFEVKKGQFHAFIGENGAGKTTTIKSIVGAYNNFEGKILINNLDNNNEKSKKFLGYVPENAVFPKELTTFKYLLSLAKLNNLTNKEATIKIESLLKEFEISDLKNVKPFNMSSGQKKKILLIQALMFDPQLLILDEPAANLDPTARFNLFRILKKLNDKGTTIFISSHVLSEIDKFVDSLTLIHLGKVLYNGNKTKSLEEIFYEKIIKNN